MRMVMVMRVAARFVVDVAFVPVIVPVIVRVAMPVLVIMRMLMPMMLAEHLLR
jgi:hypothetical protein